MSSVVLEDEAADPADVGLLGALGEAEAAHAGADFVEQAWFGGVDGGCRIEYRWDYAIGLH